MSRFYRAFDLAVAAAGYNAFHELIAHGVPTLFVPMPRQIDDQPARARWAQESGAGRGVAAPDDPALEERLAELLDPAAREADPRQPRGPAAGQRGGRGSPLPRAPGTQGVRPLPGWWAPGGQPLRGV